MKGFNAWFFMQNLPLLQNWQLKQRNLTLPLADDFVDPHNWLPANVPGSVHQDLLAAGYIPDPFHGLNEAQVQWVGECDWLYRCIFDLPSDFTDASKIALCFDGLDTFATVWLNGEQILVSDNMFVPQRVLATSLLRPGRNELRLLFESALLRGKEVEARCGALATWNGDASRLYVRKAQYHYGWDWGPVLMTAGPWRTVRLEAYEVRIVDLHCPVEVASNLQSAILRVHAACEVSSAVSLSTVTLHVALHTPTGELVAETLLPVVEELLEHEFELVAPELWWPRGYGEQPLYQLVATLQNDNVILDRQEVKLGVRRLQLVQQPLTDEPGTSFFFEINNTPIFCGGANWIPADSFTPRVTAERYRQWLQLAANANMIMLRIWGGGIYEEDVFYTLCDELGLLVWQDFMFACGLYPALDWFQKSVRAEAQANVRRLRHHPSIVLWCGNNEDYSLAESERTYDPAFAGDFLTTGFPARAIYEHLLPEVCAQFDATRPYWPGSPYGGKHSGDPTVGDVHVWSVWHNLKPYQDYPKLAGRFVSEFGMESFPAMATLASFASPDELYPQSRTLDWHNKATGGPRLITSYLVENVRIPADLESYVYITQFNQSEALAAAIRGWRRGWGGPGHERVAGALVWQLNDCWPVTSWALVDYALRPKAAYYTMRRELAPFALGLAASTSEQADVWAVNGLTTAINAVLEVRSWTLEGKLVAEERRPVLLAANQTSELDHNAYRSTDTLVLSARLLKDDKVIARGALWPEPFKYLPLSDPGIEIQHIDANTLRVSVQRPAKGVWLQADDNVTLSDNMLDVFPDDPQIILVQGSGEVSREVRWLGK